MDLSLKKSEQREEAEQLMLLERVKKFAKDMINKYRKTDNEALESN
jgi:hypothetical protein